MEPKLDYRSPPQWRTGKRHLKNPSLRAYIASSYVFAAVLVAYFNHKFGWHWSFRDSDSIDILATLPLALVLLPILFPLLLMTLIAVVVISKFEPIFAVPLVLASASSVTAYGMLLWVQRAKDRA